MWNSRRFLGYFLSSAIDFFFGISASHVLHQLLLRCALVVQDGWKSKNWMISSYSKRMRTSLDGETNGQCTGYIAYMHTFVHRYVGGGHSRKWTQEGESSGQEVAGGDVVRVRSCIADAPWIFKPGSLWEATPRIPDVLLIFLFSASDEKQLENEMNTTFFFG